MTRGAIFILVGLQLFMVIRAEMHAKHLDERAENLNSKVYTLMESTDHLLHHVSPKHPHNSWELKARPPVLGCKCCSDLAAEQGSGL